MNKHGLVVFLVLNAIILLAGCARKPNDGFRPPLAENPLEFHYDNWSRAKLLSGFYRTTFEYSDGDKLSLKAEVVVEPDARSYIKLISDRGTEAMVTITPEFVNLLNNRDKYYINEPTTAEVAERMVGLHLPSQEAACLLAGSGFDQERMEHIYADPAADGGVALRMFHATEDIRATGRIDEFGRLRSITYYDATTDEALISADYLSFRHEGQAGLVWPGIVEIYLPRRNEHITLRATDVDINNDYVLGRADKFVFARLVRGTRLHLEDIPPGAPLLYRDLKVYIQDDER